MRLHHDRVTLRGDDRAARHDQLETVISEWTMGPYHRDVSLPQPVSSRLTNATYGNGVLVLAMPTLKPGIQEEVMEFLLEAETGTRGQRVGHIGTNHVKDLVPCDCFTVPTVTFKVLFGFVILAHERRRIIYFNITEHPTDDSHH